MQEFPAGIPSVAVTVACRGRVRPEQGRFQGGRGTKRQREVVEFVELLKQVDNLNYVPSRPEMPDEVFPTWYKGNAPRIIINSKNIGSSWRHQCPISFL